MNALQIFSFPCFLSFHMVNGYRFLWSKQRCRSLLKNAVHIHYYTKISQQNFTVSMVEVYRKHAKWCGKMFLLESVIREIDSANRKILHKWKNKQRKRKKWNVCAHTSIFTNEMNKNNSNSTGNWNTNYTHSNNGVIKKCTRWILNKLNVLFLDLRNGCSQYGKIQLSKYWLLAKENEDFLFHFELQCFDNGEHYGQRIIGWELDYAGRENGVATKSMKLKLFWIFRY